ncbi:LysR family transcriptional regulator, partial [Escherichia coli]
SGSLVSRIPGAVQYFPQRRNIAPKLRALIDYVKEWRQQLA